MLYAQFGAGSCPEEVTMMKNHGMLLLPIFLMLAGCAEWPHPANVHQIALPLEAGSRFDGRTPLAGRVSLGSVASEGDRKIMGSATSARLAEFQEALSRSMEDAKLAAQGEGVYKLHATVTRAEPRSKNDTFMLGVSYHLVRAADRATVFRKAITTSHTATNDDSIQAAYRQVLAVNGAFQKNIREVIALLYRTDAR